MTIVRKCSYPLSLEGEGRGEGAAGEQSPDLVDTCIRKKGCRPAHVVCHGLLVSPCERGETSPHAITLSQFRNTAERTVA